MSRNKRISMVEFINRISEFKNKIMYIKRKYNYLKILYDPKALEDLMNLNKQEFDNLLYLLLDLRNIIYRNEFQISFMENRNTRKCFNIKF